jgi:hypothetical protein
LESRSDKEQIHDALLRYVRGHDRHDLALVLSAFHEDAVLDHGIALAGNAHEMWHRQLGPDAPTRDRVGYGDADPRDDVLVSCQHHVTNHLIDIAGNRAWSEAYFIAYYVTQRNHQRYITSVGGRYVDRFERRNGEWKIARRTSVHDWDRVDEVVHSLPSGSSWQQGTTDRSDPSYARD